MASDDDEPPSEEHYFACHNLNDVKKRQISTCFICIVCGSIFHRSCISRKKKLIYLKGSFVVCSSCCSENITSTTDARDFIGKNKIKVLASELEKSKNEVEKLKEKLSEKESQLQAINENFVQVYDDQHEISDCSEKCKNEFRVLKIVNKNLLQHNKELKGRIDDLKDLNSCLKENNNLLKENTELLKEKTTLPTPAVFCQTYKQVLLNKAAAKTNVPSLVINTNAVDMSLDTALVNIKNLVNKKKDIHVNKIFKNKKNIVLKCDSVLDNEKMCQIINENVDLKMTAKSEALKKPRIRLVGIDDDVSSMTEDGIIEDIKSRNNLCEEAELKVVYKYKNSYRNYWNIIVEVNGAAYSNIMENKRIFFASNSCRVYNDFNNDIPIIFI